MPRKAIVVLAVLCGVVPAVAAASRVQEQLQEQCSNKILFLRHSFMSSTQEYDSQGKLDTNVEEGPWIFYGSLKVKKIVLHADKLQMEGNRVIYKIEEPAKRLVPIREAGRVKVTIHLDSPLSSMDDALVVLGRVFAATKEDALNSLPEELRPYFPPQPSTQDATNAEQNILNGEKVFELGPGVEPPHVQFAPEPPFSPKARGLRFEGVVGLNVIVDSTGHVTNVKVTHPLGMGLDEEAARTVKTWRFTPAKHNGQPVAVAVYIEIDFRLYN